MPPGPLGAVAAAVGSRAGVTLTVADPDLAARGSPGVRGNYSLRQAVARILKGTGGEAIFYDRLTVRIVRRRAPPPAPPRAPKEPPAPPEAQATPDIIVTATKQTMLLQHYPGSAMVIDLDDDWLARNASGGTIALRNLLPTLGSTNLGPSRNKLFLRGIADSSFNGPTQATVGQFLGDVRLTYNAPDPNLNLYDMKRVEILNGPQGTLHGAGSLGGIIRLVPNEPDAGAAYGTAAASVSTTEKGGIGGDGAVMVNLPIVDGRSALRIIGYAEQEAGYIDAPLRGLRNINSTSVYGVRVALGIETESGWKIDAGSVIQNTLTRDGQYTLRQDPPLTRNNAFAQPFRNDYRLGYITVRRDIGEGELVSTTALVRHELESVFDATGYDGTGNIARFEERNGILLFSHETRLSGGGREAPWVVGASAVYTVNGLSRLLGPPSTQRPITGVVNEQTETALFGQFSRPLTTNLTGTLGMRLTYAHSVGHLVSGAGEGPDKLGRKQLRRSSTIAIEWHPDERLSLYYHYQQGYRAGGLAIAPAGAAMGSQRFAADDLDLNEIGFRLNDRQHRFSARAALFVAGWGDIQADLVDQTGLPYTANIGNGRIVGLEAEVSWRPISEVTISAAAFTNRSRLISPAPAFVRPERQPLPNVAEDGGRIAANWRKEIRPGASLGGEISLRYVGESRLGVGPLLDFRQGGYTIADAGARLDLGSIGLSLNIANLTDVRGNSFAFGNPFTLTQGNQITPVRPRSIRFGIDARF
ncbi:Outer membrane receptor proteins, mostly Fe transport [Novosphingobium sp. CF614]|nr:Outer membrane receptor proteins, mostly Fe transport [Novosphingobium sp. CF614]